MLYYLFDYLNREFDLPGAGVFQFLSFRAGMSILFSLIITITFGKQLINLLQKKQVGEEIRDLGLEGQLQKKGTPTMGGLIILAAIIIPTLLFARLENIYVILALVVTVWMGLVGFLDDYIKVFRKNKEGLAGKFKIVGQVGVGLIVGSTLFFHEDVVVREFDESVLEMFSSSDNPALDIPESAYEDIKTTQTTIPFVKGNEADYDNLISFVTFGLINIDDRFTWIIYLAVVTFIVTAVSNGANITDGIDGLAAGSSAIIGLALAIFIYVSGNLRFSQYLNIMYIPDLGELVIFTTAFVGACIGFLWYNSFPAQVFMGDTGSLAIGGIIAVLALAVRKEILIPLMCGIFVIENLSVIMQVSYFKYTKKKYGEGRRIFRMSPLHHHYQKGGLHEAKIVTRFWLVGLMLAILTLVTLKIR
ncbi:phospho-N-acetylmuramoyl-pentapeptide-transferase [Catalinimonas alkaloidigena]|uniref:phospho-N-acetylmuramoyl-pentapeptide- transferase n=1 Tax=Catalinimonas alkaloidigena TaxID=1075417 RepID=UPI002405C266|nr:phospho-N-acetylmuramoyl-pentapeptide-transferase [Catalinimonas alkaloidigena]MDF9801239.1 phospho-N-acetylmuramoyl-pentapeptide-transferase [Catalinimonas alkaloidigena]